MMRYQKNRDTRLRQAPHGFPQFMLRGQVKACGRLIEKERLGIMDQRSRDQDAARLSR